MAGGNIICGGVDTSDKSGSALGGVLDQIESLSEWTSDPVLSELFIRIRRTISGESDPEWNDYVEISSEHAHFLKPLLDVTLKQLVEELGTSDPSIAIERDESVEGLNPVDAKWGAGRGWRLYCVIDLLKAAEHSVDTGESIYVVFS